jgi:membrane protein YqaA with SNARE-associated domain
MTESLVESFGVYGGSLVVAFIAGLFPFFSIEVFLVGISAMLDLTLPQVLSCCLLAASSHQVSKTLTYVAGVGALERGKIKAKLDQIRPKIERWNRAPHLILFVSSAIGLPPLFILGFIAHPLMGIRFIPFTAIVFVARFGRFAVLAAIPLLF